MRPILLFCSAPARAARGVKGALPALDSRGWSVGKHRPYGLQKGVFALFRVIASGPVAAAAQLSSRCRQAAIGRVAAMAFERMH